MRKLSNITLYDVRKALINYGCKCKQGGRGGHEKWIHKDLTRPIILQSTKDPVPEFIVKNLIRGLEISKDDFFDLIDG